MKTFTHKGYSVKIEVHQDEHMGPPWKEHDGHGIVSEWVSRDKKPGELALNSDRSSKRFYDFAGSMEIAKQDGWGLNESALAELTAKLGAKPTRGQILHAAVMHDYEHLRAWCNDEWQWLGYTTEIEKPSGEKIDDSCWGFDDEAYMLEQASESAIAAIYSHIALNLQTQLAEVYP